MEPDTTMGRVCGARWAL